MSRKSSLSKSKAKTPKLLSCGDDNLPKHRLNMQLTVDLSATPKVQQLTHPEVSAKSRNTIEEAKDKFK